MPSKHKYLKIFFKEAEEHLASLQKGLLALEKEPGDRPLLRELMRNAHTLKGSAKLVGLDEISSIAHRVEDLFEEIEKGDIQVDTRTIDLLLKGTDAISRLVAALINNAEPPFDVERFLVAMDQGEITAEAVKKSDKDSSGESEKTVRANVRTLDNLINRFGELIINKKRFEDKLARLKGLCDASIEPELAAALQEFRRELEDDVLYLDYLVQEMYGDAMALRMLPLHTITDGFERMVRDLSREQGKMTDLKVMGAHIEMDRVLLETVKPMMLHILRNCVDHGIETLEERLAEGKPPKGNIQISARHEGSGVRIDFRDDGRGMNPQLIREAALRKGIIDPEGAAALDDEAALYLTLEDGFSTRDFITDTSGRGIGMGVVKKNMERMKGHLFIRSEVGRFTEITLQLPLTLSIMEALLISCSSECYAVPLSYVQETIKIRCEDITSVGGKEVISLRGVTIPLVSLSVLLGLSETRTLLKSEKIAAVVLSLRGQVIACTIDANLGSSEIVVKNLGNQLKEVRFVFGATILANGDPALILNVPDIFAGAEGCASTGFRSIIAASRAARTKGSILVVDDSITTRTMERSILTANGYQVEIAISGEDALEKVAGAKFDLVISDVLMPGITGFELTKRLRALDAYRDVPVIIVSSLASDADKRKAMEAGAQAYIVKGAFDQGNLLETVETFIG